jgi:hypothetical protein
MITTIQRTIINPDIIYTIKKDSNLGGDSKVRFFYQIAIPLYG